MTSIASIVNSSLQINYKYLRVGSCSFLYRYLNKYSWLACSQLQNGGYYSLVYSLLETQIYTKVKGYLLKQHLPTLKRHEMCDLHAARKYHKDAIVVCEANE